MSNMRTMNRREFLLCLSIGVIDSCSIARALEKETHRQQLVDAVNNAKVKYRGKVIPPLYVTAYIDPRLDRQKGQESLVAKYPLALIPQEDEPVFHRWRQNVRSRNSNILLLGYQMSLMETWVPGPGHDQLRKVKQAYVRDEKGRFVWVFEGGKMRRFFDPRKAEWQDAFLDACDATFASYPFDGLFLDQCSIFSAMTTATNARRELTEGLQNTLSRLRKRYPDKLFIANSKFNWSNINGEKNENRLSVIDQEARVFDAHSLPEIDLGQLKLRRGMGEVDVYHKALKVFEAGAFFSAAYTYQEIEWFSFYDQVIAIACNKDKLNARFFDCPELTRFRGHLMI